MAMYQVQALGKSKYHTPEVSQIRTTSIGPEDRPEGFDGMVKDDGLVHMRLESDVVIDRLAKDIYTSPTAGLREIYNNEARQCRTAQKQHGAKSPAIHIHINASKRSLVIFGTDSMGMSMQTFRDVYTVVGRSGNMNGTESGQFGFGRLAARLLSDVVIVQTYSRDTGEQFGFISKDGRAFEPARMPELESFGTKISMTVKADVSLYEIARYAHKMARFVKMDTVLCLEDDVVENPDHAEPRTCKQGMYSIGNTSERDHLTGKLKIKPDDAVDWIEFDTPGYYFLGVIKGKTFYDKDSIHHNLVGIPIHLEKEEPIIPECAGYVLNIRDERRYIPTVSRDNLTEQTDADIRADIQKEFEGIVQSIRIRSIDDYLKCKYKVLARRYDSLYGYNADDRDTKDFASLSRLHMISYTRDPEKKTDWSSRQVMEGLDLASPKPEANVMYCLAKVDEKMDAVWDIIPDAKIVFLSHEDRNVWRDTFEKFGIHNITQVLREHDIKVRLQKRREEIAEVTTYDVDYGYRRKTDVANLTDRDIRIPKGEDIREYVSMLEGNGIAGYRILKDRPQVSQGIALEEFIAKVEGTRYSEEKGKVTGKDILGSEHTCMLVNDTNAYSEKLTLKICQNAIADAQMLLIRGTKESLDELRTAMILSGKKSCYDDADDPQRMGQAMSAHLKIEYEGMWMKNYDAIADVLSKMTARHAREIYVRSYVRLFAETQNDDSHSYYGRRRRHSYRTSMCDKEDRNVLDVLETVLVISECKKGRSKKEAVKNLLKTCVTAAKKDRSEKQLKVLSEICIAALEYCFGENVTTPSKYNMLADMASYTLSEYGYDAVVQQRKKREYGSDVLCIKISKGMDAESFSFDTKDWKQMFCVESLTWDLDGASIHSDTSETYVVAEASL